MNASDKVLLAHGGGGILMHELIRKTIVSKLKNPVLDRLDDSAVLSVGGKIAFTTDSYVVRPLFFAGGDIGKLAVCGTVNDLAVQGAKPVAISLSLIVEEGFALKDMQRIVNSIAAASREAKVFVATGDLKVVERGGADQIFINTAGVGTLRPGTDVSSHNARLGDVIVINGHIADHGVSILCEREGLQFQTRVKSDCAPLSGLTGGIFGTGGKIHCMKDPTRGGLAAALNEIASSSGVGIEIEETAIPVRKATLAACEMLGLDPLVVANEGKVVVVCAEASVSKVLAAMKKHRYGRASKVIGRVTGKGKAEVVLKTSIGGSRIVDMPYGELLPRIC
jgi:hydrogenase expression/formation protein HypE